MELDCSRSRSSACVVSIYVSSAWYRGLCAGETCGGLGVKKRGKRRRNALARMENMSTRHYTFMSQRTCTDNARILMIHIYMLQTHTYRHLGMCVLPSLSLHIANNGNSAKSQTYTKILIHSYYWHQLISQSAFVQLFLLISFWFLNNQFLSWIINCFYFILLFFIRYSPLSLVWFLCSDGMTTFMGYLMPKQSL